MDREERIINALQGLTDLIAGLQKSIESLTKAGELMKARIEALEAL